MWPQVSRQRKMKQRLERFVRSEAFIGNPAISGQNDEQLRRREIQAKLKEHDSHAAKRKPLKARLRAMLQSAGLNLSVKQVIISCGVITLTAFAIISLLGQPLISAIPGAFAIGFGLPRLYVTFKTKARFEKFTNQFSEALDVIVRGIKSGLPPGECLAMIAREQQEPVKGVFSELVEAQKIGLDLEESLERARELMPTSEMQFFSIVLIVQKQTGGNLADTLANLSSILRDRKKMKNKVEALSSEAKSSAMIIGSLPFLIGGVLALVSPEYLVPLYTESTGHYMIAGGLCWMTLGILVMRKMINFEI